MHKQQSSNASLRGRNRDVPTERQRGHFYIYILKAIAISQQWRIVVLGPGFKPRRGRTDGRTLGEEMLEGKWGSKLAKISKEVRSITTHRSICLSQDIKSFLEILSRRIFPGQFPAFLYGPSQVA